MFVMRDHGSAREPLTSPDELPPLPRGIAPDALARPTDDIASEIAELSAHLSVGTARLVVLVGEFDAREGWGMWGITSCAHWLAWRCGFSGVAAREHVRVARALRGLPKITEAFLDGRLSYSKVRALTRIADAGNEDLMLEWAHHATASQLETLVRGVRRATPDANLRHARRRLDWSYDDDGTLLIRARLEPEEGAVVIRALEAAAREIERECVPAGTSGAAGGPGGVPAGTSPVGDPGDVPAETSPEDLDPDASSPGQRCRADGLVRICESYLSTGTLRRDDGDRALIVVHASPEALSGNEHGELEDGAAVESQTLRRLACDAMLLAAGTPESSSIGRRSRVVPRAMRRALRARDKACCFPGCTRAHTDAHHIQHWAHGGHTALANLVMLCRRHHRLVHEGGFRLERTATGEFVFRRPDGRPVRALTPVVEPAGAGLLRAHRERGLEITPDTGSTRWDGRTPDYAIAVEGLLRLRARAGPDP